MPYTTRELIVDSYYLSNIVARELETVSGSQINDGLKRLNAFINIKGAKTKLIPYFSVIEGNLVEGQEVYFLPNLLEIETFTFFLPGVGQISGNPVRFSTQKMSRWQYFGTPRAENIKALPYSWHLERTLGGSNLRIYFLPQANYPYQITGKFALSSTTLDQDLDTVYDKWYQEYLRYGLAIYLCEWFSVVPPQSVMDTFKEIEKELTTLSPIDLSFRKTQYFGQDSGLNWGDVNLGHGWRPGGS